MMDMENIHGYNQQLYTKETGKKIKSMAMELIIIKMENLINNIF
jgi:hypothetical protein